MTATATKDKAASSIDDRMGKVEKSLERIVSYMEKTPSGGTSVDQVFGGRNVRVGENPMTSRPYSMIKMMACLDGSLDIEHCKVEKDISDRMYKSLESGPGGFVSRGIGPKSTPRGRWLVPLGAAFLPADTIGREFRKELRDVVVAHGSDGGIDVGEMNWIKSGQVAQHFGISRQKALSWLNELSGGSLVAPPEMGELIELLRNKEALVNAGARVVPLPPQGRIKYPRQTTASQAYWVGENAPLSESQLGTGEVTLQAKKLAVLTKSPNELIRFASPAAEALIRDDMTKTLALGLDLAGLEGLGGDNRPLGIINQPGINTIASSSPGADGDALVAQDIYRFVAACEENNAEFEGYVMRPKTLFRYYQLRFDAVGQGDSAGGFLFNLIREAGDGTKASLAGFPVTKSTQVSQVRTKGASSNLTYIVGGMWSDFLIGMFGAIEFAATMQGDTAFVNDQTWIRGILTADCAPRHASAFVLMDQLNVNAP